MQRDGKATFQYNELLHDVFSLEVVLGRFCNKKKTLDGGKSYSEKDSRARKSSFA